MKIISQHKVIAGIIIIILAAGGYYFYQTKAGNKNQTHYVLSAAEKGTLIVSVAGSGNIETDETADISADISGEVNTVKVALGDKVENGQSLIIIKNDDLGIKEESALSALNIAKEAVIKVKLDRAQKYQDLYDLQQKQKSDPKVVSSLDVKMAAQKVREADLSIKSAEVKVKESNLAYVQAKTDVSKKTIKAPIGGIVTALNAKVGDEIGGTASSSTARGSLITITNLEKFFAKISLNEIDASKVKIGQKTTFTFDAIEGLTLTGIVTEIDSLGTITQGVVTYQVKILLDSGDNRIKPGMSVSAAIITDIKQDALIVPNGAVKTSGDSHYVEVFDPANLPAAGLALSSQGIVSATPPSQKIVVIGISNDTSTEIISGLNAGDLVVSRTITSVSKSTQSAPSLFGAQGSRGASFGAGSGR